MLTKGAATAPATARAAVVICAYTEKRWDRLRAAVESAWRQTSAPAEVVVAVDHNPALAARARAKLNATTVVENHGPRGLSGARNAGFAATAAEIVAFLDDDAVAAGDWLERLTAPYVDPDVLGVGGWIEPAFGGARPSALPPEFDWVVGCSYAGLPDERTPVRNMIGANMSVRREVLDDVGGFKSGIGRVGSMPIGCEETELCIRARQRRPAGEFLFEPAARVVHAVPEERTRWAYFRRRCFAEGLSKARVAATAGAGPALSSERSYVARTLPLGVARAVRDALRGDAAGVTRAALIGAGLAFTVAGYVVGVLQRTPG